MSSRDPWDRRSDRFDRHPFAVSLGWLLGGTLVVLVVALLVSVLVGVWSTGTASIRGRAGAYQRQQSSGNRVFAQAHFQDLYQAIQKDQANIAAARQALAADKSAVNETNLTGAVQVCNTDVADYDSASRQYLLKDFRDAGLPDQIEIAATCR